MRPGDTPAQVSGAVEAFRAVSRNMASAASARGISPSAPAWPSWWASCQRASEDLACSYLAPCCSAKARLFSTKERPFFT